MAQLNLYLPDELMKKIVKAARKNRSSLSRWVKEQLEGKLCDSWPPEYFQVFGSLKDSDLERAPQPATSKDAKRELL